ncbi:unnamed protein product [Calypogeia fissa]
MDDNLAASDGPKRRFLVGDLVEVRMREKGLRGSWHPAKVVEVLQGKRRVEYEELLADDEESKLRELISVGRASDGDNLMGTLPLKTPPKKTRPVLRPRPPPHPDSQPIAWQEGVWVDCFYEDAWWEGILAENITTVDFDDIAQVTRKSEVDVLFLEENDVSKMSVDLMRVGQEWDEETGTWSLKGCAPVPVVRPRNSRSKKDSSQSQQSDAVKKQQQPQKQPVPIKVPSLSKDTEAEMAANAMDPKTNEAAIESELFVNPLAVETTIIRFGGNEEAMCDSVPPYGSVKGYGYEERLHMFHLGGGSSNVSFNVGGPEPVDACPPVEEPVVEENERDVNVTDDVPMEQTDVQSPFESNVSTATQNEEIAESFLKSTGWSITKHLHRKSGELRWKCKSPKDTGTPVKAFSSLVEALSFEANGSPPGGNVQEFTSLSQTRFADKNGDVNGVSANAEVGEDEDANDAYADSVRLILKRSGWDVLHGVPTGSNGQRPYVYRAPEAGGQPRKWFKSWCLAVEECIKQKTIAAPKPEVRVPSQKSNQKKIAPKPEVRVPSQKSNQKKIAPKPEVCVPSQKSNQKKIAPKPDASVPSQKSNQKKIAPKPEVSVPSQKSNQKKRGGGRGQDSSPLPTPRRVTRRLSMSEDVKSTPEDAKKSGDGSRPSFRKSEEVPNSALPVVKLSARDDSDVDDNDKREVHIVVNSGRKRTAVDLGQNFTRSKSNSPTSPLMNLYLDKPFGTISSITQTDNAYILHVITHDIVKEKISTTVEKNDILIKARYVMEDQLDGIPVRMNGALSARLTLPKNVDREKITAKLQSPLLILTLPKSLTVSPIKIKIT